MAKASGILDLSGVKHFAVGVGKCRKELYFDTFADTFRRRAEVYSIPTLPQDQELPMHPFEQLIYERLARCIAAWNVELPSDIYVIGLLFDSGWSADAEGREVGLQGNITFWYNTLSHYATQIALASGAAEAKWNSAFWLYDPSAAVPRDFGYGTDPPDDELALRDAWCASLSLRPDGVDGSGRPTYDEPSLYKATHRACVRVAQEIHRTGVLVDKIGRPVPLLILEHENNARSLISTRAANPAGVSHELEAWLMGRISS